MMNFKYDLATTTDTVYRMGIHGLARLLREEGNPAYPGVRQTPTLSWSLDDHSINLQFESYEDLQPLLDSMLGDFSEGYAVMPGYPTSQEPCRYATILSHTGILSKIFNGSARGPKRGLSLLDKDKRALFQTHNPYALLMDHVNDVKGVRLAFAPSTNSWPAGALWDSPENAEAYAELERQIEATADKVEKKRLKSRRETLQKEHLLATPRKPITLGETPKSKKPTKIQSNGSLHPHFARWNDTPGSIPADEWFVAAFSCLSYIYMRLQSHGGYIGVGMDGATFTEAADLHAGHLSFANSPKFVRGVLLWSDGDAPATAWVLLARLRAPTGVYSIVTKTNSSSAECNAQSFLLNYTSGHPAQQVSEMFISARKDADELLVARSCPVRIARVKGRDCWASDLLSILLRNLDQGQPWFCGLEALADFSFKDGKPDTDFDRWVRFYGRRLYEITTQLHPIYNTHPQLAEFRQRFPEYVVYDTVRNLGMKLVQRLAMQELEKIARIPAKPTSDEKNRAYSKAREFLLKHNLRRTRGPTAVRDTICEIFTVASSAGFRMAAEEATAFAELLHKDPMQLRTLLVVGALSLPPKSIMDKNKQHIAEEPEDVDDNATDDDDVGESAGEEEGDDESESAA